MSNDYFNASGAPAQGSSLVTPNLRAEFTGIAAGFDKLPTLTGNEGKLAKVNASGTALVVAVADTDYVANIAAVTHAATGKTTPVDADELGLADSAASFGLKKLTWANLKATAKTYFDTLYRAIADDVPLAAGKVIVFEGTTDDAYETTLTVVDPTADRTITLPNATGTVALAGANTDITSLSALTSINGGPLAGLRNRVINGGGTVQQRAAPTLTAALQYGAADRHLIGVTGATGLAGTVSILANTGFISGVGYGAVAASWTTGAFIHKHRIEGANTKDLNGKTITISGKLYQDTGGSRSFTVSVGRPTTTLDTFSAVTNIGTSSAIPVASATVTAFSFTQALGATDGDKGLEILITDNATNTVVTKNYLVGDLQLEIGSVATSYEIRPIGMERSLCQWYFEQKTIPSNSVLGKVYSTTAAQGFKVPMESYKRVTPTLAIVSGSSVCTNATSSVAGGTVSISIQPSTPFDGGTLAVTGASGLVAGNATELSSTALVVSLASEL